MILEDIRSLMLREVPLPELPNVLEIPDNVEKKIVEDLREALAEELTNIYSRCKICGVEDDLVVAYRRGQTLQRGNVVSLCRVCYREITGWWEKVEEIIHSEFDKIRGEIFEGLGYNPNRDWNTGQFASYTVPRSVYTPSVSSISVGKKQITASQFKKGYVKEDVTYTELEGEIYRIIGHAKVDNVVMLITDKVLPKKVKTVDKHGKETEVDAQKVFMKQTKKAMREWTRNNVILEYKSCMFPGCGVLHSERNPLHRHHTLHSYTKDLSTIGVYCSVHHRAIHKTQGRSRYYVMAVQDLPRDFLERYNGKYN